MKIITSHTTELETNTYLVLNGKRAFVVDPGDGAEDMLLRAKEEDATIEEVLLTHAHFDHIGGVAALQRAGALVVMLRFMRGAPWKNSCPTSPWRAGRLWMWRGSRSKSSTLPGTPRGEFAISRRTSSFRGTPSLSCPTAGRTFLRAVSRNSKIPSSTVSLRSKGSTGCSPGTARPPLSLSRGSTIPYVTTREGRESRK